MMRRGRYSNGRRRRFVCHKCGATPPWDAVAQHRKKCHKIHSNRHREDRS